MEASRDRYNWAVVKISEIKKNKNLATLYKVLRHCDFTDPRILKTNMVNIKK